MTHQNINAENCFEPAQVNPGLARILICVLTHFGVVSCFYCLSLSFELD